MTAPPPFTRPTGRPNSCLSQLPYLMDSTLCIGIDVSQDWLDLAAYPYRKALRRFKTTPAGLRSLVEHCRDAQPRLIAFEASGGYERPLPTHSPRRTSPSPSSTHATSATTPVPSVFWPRRTASTLPLSPSSSSSQRYPAEGLRRRTLSSLLSDLVTRRTQLVKDQTREKHHSPASSPEWKPGAAHKRYLGFLKQETATIEQKLRDRARDASLRMRSERLRSVPGVGETLAAVLLGAMPELGSLNRGAVGMLAGLAPHARDSGKREGKRFCWGGRANVRTALYMPILAAIQHNPVIRAF